MRKKVSAAFVDHFREIVDPRVKRNRKHALLDIIVLTVCAVISGAETWEEIEDYGRYKSEWLKRFIPLANGIPSHDTIRRLFIRLNPQELQQCFLNWVEAVRQRSAGALEVIAIDGKTLRRSGDAATRNSALHMVSAWAAADSMVLGQVRTEDHSNEITAIPKLLELLAIKGCIVTIDAEGCQTDIAAKVRQKKADYVFALKANQPNLHEDVKYFFNELEPQDLQEEWVEHHKTFDVGHGRYETREYFHSAEVDCLPDLKRFKDAKSIGMVKATREQNGRRSTQCRYYISSLPQGAEAFAHAVRAHWSIENSLHWTLDMSFREDDSRMRTGYSAENFAMMRRIALSLVKRDTASKKTLKRRRKICNYDNEYLERLLFNSDATLARRPPS